MAIGDKQVVTIDNKRYVCTNVFQGECQSTHPMLDYDTLAVLRIDESGLYVATLNRQPITNPVPKGVAFEAVMNRVQNTIQQVA